MLVVGLYDFFVSAFVLFFLDDWVPLEDCEFLIQFEEVALQKEVFKGSHRLLSLLPIVFLRKTKELDQEWVSCDGVPLHKHG